MDATHAASVARRAEWWVACGMTVILLVGHILRLLSAGGLYRDEANSIYLATEVSVRENFTKLQFDSCPCAWFALLRSWHAIGFGQTDLGWRTLGFVIGVSLVGMTWLASRTLAGTNERRAPVTALFLIGFCPATLTVGDSLRSYGLGMCCSVATLMVTWRAIQKPCATRWAVAAAVYCLAVHVAFHNAMSVLAVGLAAACVGAWRRSPLQIVMPLTAGAVAGATLAVYIPVFRGIDEWAYLLKQPVDLGILLSRWIDSLHVVGRAQAGDGMSMTTAQKVSAAAIWLGFLGAAFVLSLGGAWRHFGTPATDRAVGARTDKDDLVRSRELLFFVTVALLVFVPAYLWVLYSRGWMPAPKYYLVAIAFTAVVIDAALRLGSARFGSATAGIVLAAAVLAAVTSPAVFEGARTRWTNIDLAAKVINEKAKDGDLVIVAPWELGVSFSRYCRPGITWMTLPPLSDNTIHRYDLYRDVIKNPAAGTEICRTVRRMSVNGGDVWYVGSELAVSPQANAVVGSPMSLHGMSCIDGQLRECEQLPPLTTQAVAPHENVTILHFRR